MFRSLLDSPLEMEILIPGESSFFHNTSCKTKLQEMLHSEGTSKNAVNYMWLRHKYTFK